MTQVIVEIQEPWSSESMPDTVWHEVLKPAYNIVHNEQYFVHEVVGHQIGCLSNTTRGVHWHKQPLTVQCWQPDKICNWHTRFLVMFQTGLDKVTGTYRVELCGSDRFDITIRLHKISFPVREMVENVHVLLQSDSCKFTSSGRPERCNHSPRLLPLLISSIMLHRKTEGNLSSLLHLWGVLFVTAYLWWKTSRAPCQTVFCPDGSQCRIHMSERFIHHCWASDNRDDDVNFL